MVDIFISYASEDEERVGPLARSLIERGASVWWDRQIPPGKTFDEVIEGALDAAKAVIAVWTERGVESRWVRTEAAEGAARGILVPVLLDDVRIPLAFRRIQAADLRDWEPGSEHDEFTGLVEALDQLIAAWSAETGESVSQAVTDLAHPAEGEMLAAMARARDGEWRAVVSLLEPLQAENPDLGDEYPGAVELLTLARRKREAAELYEGAELHYADGRWSDVVVQFDRILSLDPDIEFGDDLRTRAERHIAAEREHALADSYQRGVDALQAGEWSVAVARFEQLVADAPEHRDAAFGLERARAGAESEQQYRELRAMRGRGEWNGVAAGAAAIAAANPDFGDPDGLREQAEDELALLAERAKDAGTRQKEDQQAAALAERDRRQDTGSTAETDAPTPSNATASRSEERSTPDTAQAPSSEQSRGKQSATLGPAPSNRQSKGWRDRKWLVPVVLTAGATLVVTILVMMANQSPDNGEDPNAGLGTTATEAPPIEDPGEGGDGESTIDLSGTSVSIVADPGSEIDALQAGLVRQAEDADITEPAKALTDNEAGAPMGGGYVASATQDRGALEFSFEVEGGVYVIWGRVAAGSTLPTSQDSFFVSIDGGTEDIWDFFEEQTVPQTTWDWEPISLRCGAEVHRCDPWIVELDTGAHTLSLRARDAGSRIDAIFITGDPNALPPSQLEP